jgi:HEPN domain-containing protein
VVTSEAVERWRDWLEQGERDVQHARSSAEHEWACFAAQQGAEKAVKALILYLGGVGWGHAVLKLLESLPPQATPQEVVVDAGRRLDRHYIPPRYPNGFDAGKPGDYYTKDDAAQAISDAEAIITFCRSHLPRS